MTKTYPLLTLFFFNLLLLDGQCRPQSGQQPSQPQAGSPLDPDDINNGGNSNNISGIISRRGWRGEWRRTDPGTVYSYIWKSSDQPLGECGDVQVIVIFFFFKGGGLIKNDEKYNASPREWGKKTRSLCTRATYDNLR